MLLKVFSVTTSLKSLPRPKSYQAYVWFKAFQKKKSDDTLGQCCHTNVPLNFFENSMNRMMRTVLVMAYFQDVP